MNRAKSVDDYIASATWRKELEGLREILLATELKEEVKWGGPCYTVNGRNVVGLGSFKSYFGLWFFQGALLDDKERVLVNAQQGKTKAMRQWRMTSGAQIKPAKIRSYLKEAIKHAKEGRKVAVDRNKPVVVPPELSQALNKHKAAGRSFTTLRPALQREYADYVADAKREETGLRRIEKIIPMIRAGVGLNDKYR